MVSNAIPVHTLEARLKRAIRRHLDSLGFLRAADGQLTLSNTSKETYRQLHQAQRSDVLRTQREFIGEAWDEVSMYFANGCEVNPEKITPWLELVEPSTWQSRLFRLACLTWSVPVSGGYGRRLRFLVWDLWNGRLIGIIGLTDPVFNLTARDKYIEWNAKDRQTRLINMLDAFVLGALPPYNRLLGGKLVASLVKTTEVIEAFRKKYAHAPGTISGKPRAAHLVAVTTTSALGKSSLYNRLKLNGEAIYQRIGFTRGWGHFHVPDELFSEVREYLRSIGDKYADNHRFGDGPNWKLRALRQAFERLGIRPDLLRHGIAREVFFCSLSSNALNVLRGESAEPDYAAARCVSEMGELARRRWIEPRAKAIHGIRDWVRTSLREALGLSAALSLSWGEDQHSGRLSYGVSKLRS